jgi:hypothetical protein
MERSVMQPQKEAAEKPNKFTAILLHKSEGGTQEVDHASNSEPEDSANNNTIPGRIARRKAEIEAKKEKLESLNDEKKPNKFTAILLHKSEGDESQKEAERRRMEAMQIDTSSVSKNLNNANKRQNQEEEKKNSR